MTKLHEVRCWVSGCLLGVGVSQEEAELNAQYGAANELIIEGGAFYRRLLVSDLMIEKPTYVRIVPSQDSIAQRDGYRVVNVGVNGDTDFCAETAEIFYHAIHNMDRALLAAATALVAINPFVRTEINDLESTPDSLLRGEPEPTTDDLRSMASMLVGNDHQIGDLVSPVEVVSTESAEAISIPSADMVTSHTTSTTTT